MRWGETLVGVVLALGAILWLIWPRALLTAVVSVLVCVALVAAAFMALNYFFQGATAAPWFNPAQAYQPAVDIGILVPLLSVALLFANLHALRHRQRPVLVNPDTGQVERAQPR